MSVATLDGDQSSDSIVVELTAIIQKWIDDNNALIQSGSTPNAALDLMLVASTFGIEESTTKFVNICSTDATDCDTPTLEITYDWDSTGPPVTPTTYISIRRTRSLESNRAQPLRKHHSNSVLGWNYLVERRYAARTLDRCRVQRSNPFI